VGGHELDASGSVLCIVARFCEHGNELYCSTIGGEFLEYLSDYQLLEYPHLSVLSLRNLEVSIPILTWVLMPILCCHIGRMGWKAHKQPYFISLQMKLPANHLFCNAPEIS
jgi:hypothetical protein